MPAGFGEDDGTLAVGGGGDGLLDLFTLGAQLVGDALALRSHARENVVGDLLGQVGAPDAHVDDLDAEGFACLVHVVLDVAHDVVALGRQQVGQGVAAHHLADAGVQGAAQTVAQARFVVDRLQEAQRIDDAVAGEGIDVDALLVRQDHFLGIRVEIEDALVELDHVLDKGNLEVEPGFADDPHGFAELQDDDLLALVDGKKRAGRDDAEDDDDDADDGEGHSAHFVFSTARFCNSGNGR